jgi:hypothetical protein
MDGCDLLEKNPLINMAYVASLNSTHVMILDKEDRLI